MLVEAKVTPANGWSILLKDSSDMKDALGYHFVTPSGQPQGIIFLKTCLDAGMNWTSCFAHEIAEMVADPFCQWMALDAKTGFIYPQEICDAVEDNLFLVDGVTVSNFLLMTWFSPAPAVKFDYLGVLKSAFSIAASGYVSRIENGIYRTVWGDRVKPAVKERVHSRVDFYKQMLIQHLKE